MQGFCIILCTYIDIIVYYFGLPILHTQSVWKFYLQENFYGIPINNTRASQQHGIVNIKPSTDTRSCWTPQGSQQIVLKLSIVLAGSVERSHEPNILTTNQARRSYSHTNMFAEHVQMSIEGIKTVNLYSIFIFFLRSKAFYLNWQIINNNYLEVTYYRMSFFKFSIIL